MHDADLGLGDKSPHTTGGGAGVEEEPETEVGEIGEVGESVRRVCYTYVCITRLYVCMHHSYINIHRGVRERIREEIGRVRDA